MTPALAAICFLARSADGGYQTDSRLQGVISLREVLAPMDKVVKDLETVTHVHFTVSPSIADRKLTLVFQNHKASEAMQAMETALFIEWLPTPDGYRLQLTDQAKDEERRQLIIDRRNAETAIANQIERFKKYFPLSPEETNRRRQDDASALSKLGTQDPKVEPALREELSDLDNPQWIGILKSLAADSPKNASDLADGEGLALTTEQISGTLPVEVATMPSTSDGTHVWPATSAQILVRFRPDQLALEALMMVRTDINQRGAIAYSSILPLTASQEKLGPLETHLRRWGQKIDPKVADTPIPANHPQIPDAGYKWFSNGALSLAEHLAALSDWTGVPVIADAYRRGATPYVTPEAATVADYLEKIEKSPDNFGQPVYFVKPGAVRTENGWLMVRHANYWRLNLSEIPESALLPFEAKLASGKDAEIDDYASIATQITPIQRAGLDWAQVPLARFLVAPIYTCCEPLKLWATLSPDQRTAALAGGVSATTFSQEQLQTTGDVLWDQFWHCSSSADATFACLTRRADPSQIKVAFTVTQQTAAQIADLLKRIPQLVMKVEDKAYLDISLSLGKDQPMGLRVEMDKGKS